MSGQAATSTTLPIVTVREASTSVLLNYLVSNLGYYTLLPVLPLLLARAHPSTPWLVGAGLFTLAFSVRASSLLLVGWVHGTTVRVATSGGLFAAAIAFATLAVDLGGLPSLACLAVAGSGISVNTMAARAFVALVLPSAAARTTAFSAVQVGVNVAAAVGPIAANLLFSNVNRSACLLVVSVLYAIAACVVSAIMPRGLRLAGRDERKPSVSAAVKAVVTDPQLRTVSCVAVAGWFLYGQLFSALTLHIGSITTSPLLRSSFFTVNAVLVVAVQIPVTTFANRQLKDGATPLRFLLSGLGLFGAAFGSMAAFGGGLAGTFAALVVFSVAETFFTPFVSTAFAAISEQRPVVEAFTFMQITMSVGEPAGSFSGGALYPLLSRHGAGLVYWVALCGLALLAVLAFSRPAVARAAHRLHTSSRRPGRG